MERIGSATQFEAFPRDLVQASPQKDKESLLAELDEFDPDDDDDDEYPDDDEDDEFDGYFDDEDDVAIDLRGRAGRAAANGATTDWRRQTQLFTTGIAPYPRLELVYFLEEVSGPTRRAPWEAVEPRGTPKLEVVFGQRRRQAPGVSVPAELRPAQFLRPEELAEAIDRELLAELRGCHPERAHYYGSSPKARVEDWVLGVLLEKLAKTGRCHLVPSEFARDAAWVRFKSGGASRGNKSERYAAFQQFLSWPVLKLDESPVELELQLVANPESKARSYSVRAELVRGEERLGAPVQHVSQTGKAIIGNTLMALSPADARWLAGLKESPLTVPEADLEEFASLALGSRGASRFRLPAGFQQEGLEGSPVKRLELGTPGSRNTSATVRFDYGEHRVQAEAPERIVFLGGQRVLARDSAFERAAFGELRAAGFRGSLLGTVLERRGPGSRAPLAVENAALLPAIHALLAQGWEIYGEGKRYQSLSSFNIEFESGIDWFEVKGRGRFGETAEVPFPALLRALKKNRGIVELGDGSRGLLPEQWAARFGTVADLLPEKGDTLRFSKRQLGVLGLLCALAPDASGAEALRELRARLVRFHELEPGSKPQGFHGELRPYQALGLGFLQTSAELGFGACLADDMGLGKTIQVLAYLQSVHGGARGGTRAVKGRAPARAKSSLVVVPRSLLGNWVDEAKRFAPELRVHVHWGALRGEPGGTSWGDAQVILTTYGTLRLDALALSKLEFETVVLDESQAIKNQDSATAKAAKLLRAQQRFAMSGTPIENHIGELWSLFEFLNPGLLAELPSLKRAALGRVRPSPEACELIRRAVRPFVLRRTKREVATDLPERIEQTLYVDLDKEERAHYDELAKHYRAQIGKKVKELGAERSTPHVLEALLRLRQAACHPGLIDPSRTEENSAKLELLLERLRAVQEEGHQALVFSQFTSLLSILRKRLEDAGVAHEYLDGQTKNRDERVRRFQSDPSVSVFLISLKAGGVGLNLTSADYVFILDPWWNPAAEAQAIDRAHRIGQTRTVIALRLLARGTVEERVADLQNQKRELVEALMGEGALGAKLTRKDLEALLELGEPSSIGSGVESGPRTLRPGDGS